MQNNCSPSQDVEQCNDFWQKNTRYFVRFSLGTTKPNSTTFVLSQPAGIVRHSLNTHPKQIISGLNPSRSAVPKRF